MKNKRKDAMAELKTENMCTYYIKLYGLPFGLMWV